VGVQQVLMNLCTNAYHAMRDDPRVGRAHVLTVGLGPVEVGATEASRLLLPGAGTYARLSVRDTGPGVPPAILGRIFDPYFTTKQKGDGTGLGLAVALNTIRAHLGTISVESEPGNGATFHVLLPAQRAAAAERPCGERTTPAAGGAERVLLVDDEPALARLAQEMLARLGYRVTRCDGAREALLRFAVDPAAFDIVVADIEMPGLSGVELMREMHALRPELPFLLVTGFSQRHDAAGALAAGARAFLSKPFDAETLAAAVRSALS
jgi:CheY-like chemotaxis protein